MVPPPEHRWKPGASANPGGRPKLARPPSVALAELNETAGADLDEIIANYRAKRGAGFCGADLTAVQLFKRQWRDENENGQQVAAFNAATDRLEGKVSQLVTNINATLTAAELVAMTDEQLEALARPR